MPQSLRFLPTILLVVLLPTAILLNHDVISAIMGLVWTMLVIPVCICQGIDYLTNETESRRLSILPILLRFFIGFLGFLTVIIGIGTVLWILYNVFVHRQPEYTEPEGILGFIFGCFGIAQFLGIALFGIHLICLSFRPGPETEGGGEITQSSAERRRIRQKKESL